MRRPPVLLTLLLASVALARADDAASTLKRLRGVSQAVVVLSDKPYDPQAERQLATLDEMRPALAQRGIAVLAEVRLGGRLRQALDVARSGFAVVLVGKDGSVITEWHAPVDPQQIFALTNAPQ